MNTELEYAREFAADLNNWLNFREFIWGSASVDPDAVRRAADRHREGIIEVVRRACDELGRPLPREIDLILGPRAPGALELPNGKVEGSNPSARSNSEVRKRGANAERRTPNAECRNWENASPNEFAAADAVLEEKLGRKLEALRVPEVSEKVGAPK